MEEFEYLNILYDYYMNLLTDRQKEFFEDYYFENLTILEIAENNNISKNAVSKSLIEVKEKLEYYEKVLKLYEKKCNIKKILNDKDYNLIEKYI